MGSIASIFTAGAEHTVAQAKIDAARTVQSSANQRSAAEASLNNFAQSLGNQRRLNAAGKQDDALQRNIAALGDQVVAGKLQDRLAAAEALGQVTVAAAAGGVGGSSIDTYKRTMELRSSIQEESQSRAAAGNKTNMSAQRGAMLEDAVAGQNQQTYVGNIDYTQYVDHQRLKTTIGSVAALTAATFFGGPQAGMAVADVQVASNKYANGDFAGGNQLITQAAGSGLNALGGYQKSNGNPWGLSGGGGTSSLKGYWNSLAPSSFTIK